MSTHNWVKGAVDSAVMGIATAGASWAALHAEKAEGVNVPNLNWKALGTVLVIGCVLSLSKYALSHPLGEDDSKK
jgi:membrane-associated PAP2 superfamily phosphatase